MRIVVTGGTGFIGRHVVKELQSRGHRLLVISRKTHREKGLDFLKAELSSMKMWLVSVKRFKPEAAVHLAWEGLPDFSYDRNVKNLQISIDFFVALAEMRCKKIIAMGTGYECVDYVGKISEDIEILPQNPIAAAKKALHVMGNELAREQGIDFIWLRPFRPYGSGQRPEALIPYIMRCVADRLPLRLKQPLAQGDFIHARDIARAVASAVARGRGSATYNVGSGYRTAVRDIAEIICREMGTSDAYRKDFRDHARGRLDPASYADLKNVRKDIGWRPRIDMKTGIKEMMREFKNAQ